MLDATGPIPKSIAIPDPIAARYPRRVITRANSFTIIIGGHKSGEHYSIGETGRQRAQNSLPAKRTDLALH
jgi:hypothetical protein